MEKAAPVSLLIFPQKTAVLLLKASCEYRQNYKPGSQGDNGVS